MNFSEINKTAWDYKSYDYWRKKYGEPSDYCKTIINNPKDILGIYYNYLGKFEGVSIVNVCGSMGKLGIACAALGSEVTIIDFSEDAERYATEMANSQKIQLTYRREDILKHEVKIQYDVSLLYMGISHYFANLEELFKKVYLLTKPDGMLVYSDFHPFLKMIPGIGIIDEMPYFDRTVHYGDMPYAKHYLDIKHYPKCIFREYTMGDIINTVIKSGFQIEQFDEYSLQYPCKFVLKGKK